MSKVDIDIQIDGGRSSHDVLQFAPNDTIKGTVSIYPNSNVRCRNLLIQLEWHTEGRGTRYTAVIQENNVWQEDLQEGMPHSFNFNFSLPNEPWSFSGRYVSVVWGITVKIDVPMAKDINQTENFLVVPTLTAERGW